SDHSKHPEPPHVPAVQKSCIGLYSDATPISSGLFSTIYRAPIAGKQNEPASIVALKVTNVANMSMPHDCFEEARLLKVVGGHSNILSIVDTFMLSASYFVSVSPFLPSTLDYLMEDGAITAKLTVEIISGIFSGLSHIHSLGILHRDIKPSNIFYDTCSRNAVIGDFGIAWCNDKTSEPSQQKCTDVGTTCYRAPELLFGYTAYGEGVDIWATGCVLAQCLHPEHKCIFDAGDLGSELRLISSIFQTLGTPTTETWPESSQFPDFGKITFVSYPPKPWDKLLPSVESSAVDLLSKLLTYESQDRLSAVEVTALAK
ncbi:putative cell division protein kinase, partial [Geopyxis carbonaria]